MSDFTPISALMGGALIGASASIILLFHGAIAGVSGILATAVESPRRRPWKIGFLLGLLVGGVIVAGLWPRAIGHTPRSWELIAAAGALVGFGTQLGSGCTSGHGVCGLARLSLRSLVATVTFMTTGVLTTYVALHLLVGAG
jgi:uncharacterized membrane protein YedE/YeeE